MTTGSIVQYVSLKADGSLHALNTYIDGKYHEKLTFKGEELDIFTDKNGSCLFVEYSHLGYIADAYYFSFENNEVNRMEIKGESNTDFYEYLAEMGFDLEEEDIWYQSGKKTIPGSVTKTISKLSPIISEKQEMEKSVIEKSVIEKSVIEKSVIEKLK